VALKDSYTSVDDEDDEEEEDESPEECSTSTSCIPPLETSSRDQKEDNIMTTASNQANSVAPSSEPGGIGFNSDQHQVGSSSSSHQPSEVFTAPSTSLLCTNNSKSQVTRGKRKKGSEVDQFVLELDKMTKKDKRNVLELIKRVRRQEDELTR
jgi:hypothetical protein